MWVLGVEDDQRLVIEKVLSQIHHLHYQDVILQCQVNNLSTTYFLKLSNYNPFVSIYFLILGSPLESPKVVHPHPHFPFVSIKR